MREESQRTPRPRFAQYIIFCRVKMLRPRASLQIENVGGQANPQEPVILASGTVFALTIAYKPDLPSGTIVAVSIAVTDSNGKTVRGSEVMYSIEPKAEVGTKVGGNTVTPLQNTFEVKGLIFSKGGAFKPTDSAALSVRLVDKGANREGSHIVAAKLRGTGEVIDRKQAAKLWQGSRDFVVP